MQYHLKSKGTEKFQTQRYAQNLTNHFAFLKNKKKTDISDVDILKGSINVILVKST